MPTILLFSGPIASGKTTLADELIAQHDFRRIKSSDYLRSVCAGNGREISRTTLQQIGDQLDGETDYRWLVDEVAMPQLAADPRQHRWLIDSVRKERQVSHFRSAFGAEVFHVHVWAPGEVLRERFEKRMLRKHNEGSTSYSEAIAHPNEISARALSGIADYRIDLSITNPREAAAQIEELLRGSG